MNMQLISLYKMQDDETTQTCIAVKPNAFKQLEEYIERLKQEGLAISMDDEIKDIDKKPLE